MSPLVWIIIIAVILVVLVVIGVLVYIWLRSKSITPGITPPAQGPYIPPVVQAQQQTTPPPPVPTAPTAQGPTTQAHTCTDSNQCPGDTVCIDGVCR